MHYDNMTLQYFLFSTYTGDFIQVLPFALLAGLIFGLIRFKNDRATKPFTRLLSCAFVCYVTGVVLLALFMDVIKILWYAALYHRSSGITLRWFGGDFNLVPDFLSHIGGEVVGNFIFYLPYGLLYPFFDAGASWKRTALTGIALILTTELLQPVFGRAFDVNDIILNASGLILSAALYTAAKKLINKRKNQKNE